MRAAAHTHTHTRPEFTIPRHAPLDTPIIPIMKIRVYLTLISLITPITLHANGGGYHHGTKFTGSPTPFQPTGTEHIRILDE